MKKTIYTFCAGVFALLTIIGCSKSDDNNGEEKKQVKTSNFNIPKEAKAIIPDEVYRRNGCQRNDHQRGD